MWRLRLISLPHLRRQPLRTCLTISGVSAGVVAVVATAIVSRSVLLSFEETVTKTTGTADLIIENGGVGLAEELIEEVGALPLVTDAIPLIEGFVPLLDRPGETIAVFGVDVLGARHPGGPLTRSMLEIPDEVVLIADPGSVIVPRSEASLRVWRYGSQIAVTTAAGSSVLVVRGFVDDQGLARIFGGAFVLMDLPAAQLLLGRERRIDRLDIVLRDSVTPVRAAPVIEAVVGGRGFVTEPAAYGRRAGDMLLNIRLMLAQAGALSLVVGLLIIYHTMSVSIAQRRREFETLRAYGSSSRAIVVWLALEATALGTFASLLGFGAAVALAVAVLSGVEPLTNTWIRLPPPTSHVGIENLAQAFAVGLGMALLATLVAARRELGSRSAAVRSRDGTRRQHSATMARRLLAAAATFAVTAVLIAWPPRTASFGTLLFWVVSVGMLPLLGLSLASVVPSLGLGLAGMRGCQRRRGVVLHVACATLVRSPTAPLAVVAAMVVALGWTVGNRGFLGSVERTFLSWADVDCPPTRLYVTAAGGFLTLTSHAFSDEVVTELRTVAGVQSVAAERAVEAKFAGRRIILIARDATIAPTSLSGVAWQDVHAAFQKGEVAFLSDSLANLAEVSIGDTIQLRSPSGPARFRVAGLTRNVSGGDVGSVVVARARYSELWRDPLITGIEVDARSPAGVAALRAAINERFSAGWGLQALDRSEQRRVLADLMSSAFSAAHSLVLVGFCVSFLAVANFLLTSLVEREPWYRVLAAVGLRPLQLRGTIIAEGALLGVVGAAVGIVAAVVTAWVGVRYSIPVVNGWHFDFHFPIATALITAGASVALAALAAVIPARTVLRRRSGVDAIAR